MPGDSQHLSPSKLHFHQSMLGTGQGWQSHRIENCIASHVFFRKISHQNNHKNCIRYRIAEFDKKNRQFFF